MAAPSSGSPRRVGRDSQELPAALDLTDLLTPSPRPFALLHRPDTTGPEHLELLVGDVHRTERVEELPLRPTGPAGEDLVVLMPYRQLAERELACRDDGEPLLALVVTAQTSVTRAEVLDRLPARDVELLDGGFDPDDEEYAAVVERVLAEEIGEGAGSNFVIHRSFTAGVDDQPVRAALALFRALLAGERGAYWTFVVHTGDRTFVGATPERHVSLRAGTAVMNPISGTLRHPAAGPSVEDVLTFLADTKEADELYMVVDEELKMMARICDERARVVGPRLKEMGRLTHTEYLLEGASSRDVREVLRETMFAPTVIGSPLENAARVIARHEPTGRSYYSGVVAVVGRDDHCRPVLDSSILIRTAVVDADRTLRLGVGATLVRDSDPHSEVAETRAKAEGVLAAARSGQGAGTGAAPRPVGSSAREPRVRAALEKRNTTLSRFWLGEDHARHTPLAGVRGVLVEAEDTFTAMLALQLRALGAEVSVRSHRDLGPDDLRAPDLDVVVLGPGPGDPRETGHPKIARLRELGSALLAGDVPFLAICLGHQVIASLLGLTVVPLPRPNQGTQQRIDLFGRHEPVAFYNTFVARHDRDELRSPIRAGRVDVSRDRVTGHVHGLRGAGFTSLQFHPESVLTQNGERLLGDLLGGLLAARREPVA